MKSYGIPIEGAIIGDDDTYIQFGTNTITMAAGAATGIVIDANGDVTFANQLYIADYIYHTGDVDTYIRFQNDRQDFVANATTPLVLQSAQIITTGLMAHTGNLDISEYLRHLGDTTTYIRYQGSNIQMAAGGNVGVTIDSGGDLTFGYNLYVPEYIYHAGDTDTYIRFTTNQIIFYAGNNQGAFIDSSGNFTVSAKLYVPEYIHHTGDGDNTYIQFGTNTITMVAGADTGIVIDANGDVTFANQLYVADYIYHTGDTNTYIQFADDSVALVANGNFASLNSSGNFGIGVGAGSYKLNVAGNSLLTGHLDVVNDIARVANIYVDSRIYNRGDADTYIQFDTNSLRFISGGTERLRVSVGLYFLSHPTTALPANAYISTSTGEVYRSTSSERYKLNIADLVMDTSKIFDLRPTSFECKTTGAQSVGFIAEEVAEIIPEMVEFNDKNEPEAVYYSLMPVLMLEEMKKLRARIEALESEKEIL